LHRTDINRLETGAPSRSLRLDQVRVRLWPAAAYETDTTSFAGVVGYAFDAQTGYDAFASDRKKPFRREANTVAWIPPRCPVFSCSAHGGEYLTLEGMARDQETEPFGDHPVNRVTDAQGRRAALALRRLILSAVVPDPLEVETNIDHLRESALRCTSRETPQWLTPGRLKRIDAFIEANLSSKISVADLAAELDLSSGFLTRAFAQSVAVTPHAYIMNWRLSRARYLLAYSSTPIAQIASQCGFSHQSHLNRHLLRQTGLSPSAYRLLLQ
jgi:AraC family transcriptional regulator